MTGAGVAADLDPAIAVLDLDLGQLIVGEQLGELPHQRRIDAHRALVAGLPACGPSADAIP